MIERGVSEKKPRQLIAQAGHLAQCALLDRSRSRSLVAGSINYFTDFTDQRRAENLKVASWLFSIAKRSNLNCLVLLYFMNFALRSQIINLSLKAQSTKQGSNVDS